MKSRKLSNLPDSNYSPFSVSSIEIKQRIYNIRPEEILQNIAFHVKEPKASHKIHWFKSKSTTASKLDLSQISQTKPSPLYARRKHFLTSPFGVILKGKKLKQRNAIGNMFRENIENNPRSAVIRNDLNMRSKWK